MYFIAFHVLSILDVWNLEELKAVTLLSPKNAFILTSHKFERKYVNNFTLISHAGV